MSKKNGLPMKYVDTKKKTDEWASTSLLVYNINI